MVGRKSDLSSMSYRNYIAFKKNNMIRYNMKKIIIFGFPHSGTTILRTIISHIPEVYTYIRETRTITKEIMNEAKKENKSIILIKYPFMINMNKYKDYEKIFIIRNPLYVFSSLNIRFSKETKFPFQHEIESYNMMAQKFINTQGKNINNLYHVKYEDMFNNNNEKLKIIFDKMELTYTDKIFNNTSYLNSNDEDKDKTKINEKIHKIVLNTNPEPYKDNYRTWQINQKFQNMNYPKKINLKKRQMKYFQESTDIAKIYNIKKCRFRKKSKN